MRTESTVCWVAEMLHPHGNAEGLTIVLKAYIDDSGTNMAERVVAVAGFVASKELWASFEKMWREFLDEYELKRFHAAEYWSRKGRPYSRWNDETWEACGRDVCKVFSHVNPFGIGNTVDIDVFNEWRKRIDYFVDPDPYYFCLDLCLRSLIRGIAQEPHDEGVLIFIDQDKGREALGKDIARWHESYIRHNTPNHINKDRTVSTAYVSSIEYLPLQAADILVHGCFQWIKEFLQTDEFGYPAPQENQFIQSMKMSGVPLTIRHFHSRELFEIEARKRREKSS